MSTQSEIQPVTEAVIAETDIVFECPKCGQSLVIDEAAAGRIVDCLQCQTYVIVPAKPAPPPAASELLLQAARQGDLEKLTEVLDGGADVNAVDATGTTALMLVAELGHEEIVQTLLKKRANRDLKRADGQTAVMLAERAGHYHIVRLIWKAGTGTSVRFFGGGRR